MFSCRVIVAGCRDFHDYCLLCDKLGYYFQNINKDDIEIVSGGAKGVDTLGEMFANEKGLALKVFPADWDKYGRGAGPIRNNEMAKYGTHLIAFWDGKSKGTKNMIEQAEKYNLKTRVVRI